MKLQFKVLILAAVAWPAFGESRLAVVDVYVNGRDDSAQLLGPGKLLASSIFQRIGVHVNWRTGELGTVPVSKLEPAFGIRTLERAPDLATPGALASARLVGSSGTEISVYEDRVRHFLDSHSNLAGVAAGYVLAHELAHAMQGVPRHSEAGILKAQWSNADFQEMIYQRLVFTNLDVDLIHEGLAIQLASVLSAAGSGAPPALGLPKR
jgi:hypothetical protein